MGKVIEARFEVITPGKLGVFPEHLVGVAERVMMNKPLFPLVTRESKFVLDKYITLDEGNSRAIYALMAGQTHAPMFVAESSEDRIRFNQFYPILGGSVVHANDAIKDRWEESENIAMAFGIKNFRDYFQRLVRKYPYLESVPKFLNYCATHREECLNPAQIIGELDDID